MPRPFVCGCHGEERLGLDLLSKPRRVMAPGRPWAEQRLRPPRRRGQCRAAPCDPPSPDLGALLPWAQPPAERRFGPTGAAAPGRPFAEAGAPWGKAGSPDATGAVWEALGGGQEGPTGIAPDEPGHLVGLAF